VGGSTATRKAPQPAKTRTQAKASAKPPARIATNQPRLTVSSAVPLDAAGPRAANASEAEQARAQQELADALEAETVVLRQRIVELTAMVERMQQEVRANELAQRPADEPAKPAPPVEPTAWWGDQNWPLLSTIVGVPLLLAGGLLWRRKQRESVTVWPTTSVASLPAAADPATVAPPLQNAAAGVSAPVAQVTPPAPRQAPGRTRMVRDGVSALAVSELLHVTEEARVYVSLGHPERAIDVLNQHIREVPRSVPAVWLMLLDLYRTTGRQEDFRRLAEEFHQHCNVQAPTWEDFTPGESDESGLETFPHVLRQVASLWRQPGCREYLERLLYDNREGRRIGFPVAAYGEILLLLQVLDAPPVGDIDSDLVNEGKLESIAKRAPASESVPPSGPPRVESRRVRPASVEALQHPAQQPLELEPGIDEAARASAGAKKV